MIVVLTVLVVLVMVVHMGQVVVQGSKGTLKHRSIEVTALAGVDLHRRHPGFPDPLGIQLGLLIAFDHQQGKLRLGALQAAQGFAQQRGLAGAGTGNQVERKNPVILEALAVAQRNLLVRPKNIFLQTDGTRDAKPRHRHSRGVCAKVERA